MWSCSRNCQNPSIGISAVSYTHLGIDGYWVGHTKAWVIPGTEDLMPYISKADKQKKWLFGTVGMAVISLLPAGLGLLL